MAIRRAPSYRTNKPNNTVVLVAPCMHLIDGKMGAYLV